jgi:glutaredoxin 3
LAAQKIFASIFALPHSILIMASTIRDTVKKLISDNPVMVFSKSYCPYCAKAKAALSKYNPKNMKVLELDEISNGDDYQDALQVITGGRSVPRVFIGGKFIGGGDDTVAADKSGQLKE